MSSTTSYTFLIAAYVVGAAVTGLLLNRLLAWTQLKQHPATLQAPGADTSADALRMALARGLRRQPRARPSGFAPVTTVDADSAGEDEEGATDIEAVRPRQGRRIWTFGNHRSQQPAGEEHESDDSDDKATTVVSYFVQSMSNVFGVKRMRRARHEPLYPCRYQGMRCYLSH